MKQLFKNVLTFLLVNHYEILNMTSGKRKDKKYKKSPKNCINFQI